MPMLQDFGHIICIFISFFIKGRKSMKDNITLVWFINKLLKQGLISKKGNNGNVSLAVYITGCIERVSLLE